MFIFKTMRLYINDGIDFSFSLGNVNNNKKVYFCKTKRKCTSNKENEEFEG